MTGPSLNLDALRRYLDALESGLNLTVQIWSVDGRILDLAIAETRAVLALVDEQRKENERLRKGLTRLRDYGALGDEFVRMLAETTLAGSPAENKGNLSLVDRLVAYSDHLKSCPVAGKRPPGVCTCGYLALLDALAGPPAEGKKEGGDA